MLEIDFDKNKTMKMLGKCGCIPPKEPEKTDIYEFLDGVGISRNDSKMLYIIILAYMLGAKRAKLGGCKNI